MYYYILKTSCETFWRVFQNSFCRNWIVSLLTACAYNLPAPSASLPTLSYVYLSLHIFLHKFLYEYFHISRENIAQLQFHMCCIGQLASGIHYICFLQSNFLSAVHQHPYFSSSCTMLKAFLTFRLQLLNLTSVQFP